MVYISSNALCKCIEKHFYGMLIRSMCWSPRGKQLVVGKADGSLSQLKMDLTEAKKIQGPCSSPLNMPTSILWTNTLQFLICFDVQGSDISKGICFYFILSHLSAFLNQYNKIKKILQYFRLYGA